MGNEFGRLRNHEPEHDEMSVELRRENNNERRRDEIMEEGAAFLREESEREAMDAGNESDRDVVREQPQSQQRQQQQQAHIIMEEIDEEIINDESEREETQRRGRGGDFFGEILFGSRPRQQLRSPFIDLFGDLVPHHPQHGALPRRVTRPPRIHETTSVQCDVNLYKDTLRLLPVKISQSINQNNNNNNNKEKEEEEEEEVEEEVEEVNKSLYQLHFRFDSNVACKICVFFVAKEKRDENNDLVGYVSLLEQTNVVPPQEFHAGMKQEYIQPLTHLLDTSVYREDYLDYNTKEQTFPVIIVIEPLDYTTCQVSAQATFATLLKCADDTFAIKAVKVKIEYGGVTYVVHDIYGLDPSSETGKECVICMSESRDTIVLPCRHMCLCRDCAEVLRYQTTKCPICRSAFTSLLKVHVSPSLKMTNKESDGECEVSKGKSKQQNSLSKKNALCKQKQIIHHLDDDDPSVRMAMTAGLTSNSSSATTDHHHSSHLPILMDERIQT